MLTESTVSLQNVVDKAQLIPGLEPIYNVAGFTAEPALTVANDVMNAICALPFPHKWNEIPVPVFYTNSFQQDYAIPGLTTLSWLERGIVIDVQSTATPKPWRNVEVGRQLTQATGTWQYLSVVSNPLFLVNWFPNKNLYYGTWGDADTGYGTTGNNPVSGSVYTSPLASASMPSNPITQIQDANDNYLVLTTYGTEGSTAPLAAANAAAGTTASGTGATTVWTVVDPNGQGMRILPVPSQSGRAWQFNLWGQAKPTRFTRLNQKLDPLPDEFEPHFRQGFIAQSYRYAKEAAIRGKFEKEWALWLQSLDSLRKKSDREPEENMFVPDRGVMGRSRRAGAANPAYPFSGPAPF